MDKKFALYIARVEAQRRLMRGVRSAFEQANMHDWLERLGGCKSLRAIRVLMAEFELAEME